MRIVDALVDRFQSRESAETHKQQERRTEELAQIVQLYEHIAEIYTSVYNEYTRASTRWDQSGTR
jgi:hypothetical protein